MTKCDAVTRQIYAHSKTGCPVSDWHTLEDHLRGTAERARSFASKFDSGDWGYFAGLWHDLGKYAPDWQKFLLETQTELGSDGSSLGEDTPIDRRSHKKRGPDHSTAGAIHAAKSFRSYVAKLIASTIAGHHAGLADDASLGARLEDEAKLERYALALTTADPIITQANNVPHFPSFFPGNGDQDDQKRRYEMLIRMVYSTLVDADFLDTEKFMEISRDRSTQRTHWRPLADYLEPLDHHLSRLTKDTSASRNVRDARGLVLRSCIESSRSPRGAFTLTVPTGGGKTLASLAFALRHAVHHRLDRIIIALPFLSILDQTAQTLRKIYESLFGSRVLVEHHSNIVPEYDTLPNRLAAENWDAPLIVTTQVQLFESLFGRRSSDCRKLHNISNSVIVLDEVQTLPIGLLDPILEILRELTSNYGASLLLTTATQPALHSRSLGAQVFRGLIPAPREIVPSDEIEGLFESLRRVEVTWPSSVPSGWGELSSKIMKEPRVLAIVHRRADAAELWRALNDQAPGALHLSALMCAAHRRGVLADIRKRLEDGVECRVVSTQLVEAGVDVDFPVVYRAMAGLESLAQSAGRCNREGKLDRGRFIVYRANTEPVGSLRHHKEVAETMLRLDGELDLFAPQTFRTYFDRLYSELNDRDVRRVQSARQAWQFEETTIRFRMIDDATTTIFVPFDAAGNKAIDALRFAGPSRDRFRALQPYGVAVYPDALKKLQQRGAIELLHDSVWALLSNRDYDNDLGLLIDREAFEQFIV